MTKLVPVATDLAQAVRSGGPFDAVVVVAPDLGAVDLDPLAGPISARLAVDAKADSAVSVLACAELAGGRLILAPTGPVGRDQDDVRRFGDAAAAGLRRARDAGAKAPVVVVCGTPADPLFAHVGPVTALAAIGGLWEPLEAREVRGGDQVEPVETVGFAVVGASFDATVADWVNAVDAGVRVAKDLCGTEPERMAPPRFAEYCVEAFAGLPVEIEVVDDPATIARDYPLVAAVARASMGVERHRPRIVRLVYQGEGPIARTILFAGKGVTFDTGGADLKIGGAMAGMSRDKGGAAAVAGFVHAVAALRPKGVRVVAELGCVRNSIGSEAYVSDEIVTSHAGLRVRIGNTDAEGRMVLADLLSHLRERATRVEGPLVLSVATLTGHAGRAVGAYNIALDNAPARDQGVARSLGERGDLWGDPFEVSRLRREDWDFVKGRTPADDLMQCNSAPSTATSRGHQFPMAFLAIASGLDQHGKGARQAVPYTHVDIGGSACEGGDWQHGRPTGRPVVGMLAALVEGVLPA